MRRGSVDMVRRQTKRVSRNVTEIKNEYVHTLQQQKDLKSARKVRLYRRLAVLAVIVVVSFGILTNLFFGQKKVLAAKEKERQVLLATLAEQEETYAMLTKQLEKLNDDTYIAKLARQEYFLSDEHEIIFSIPKKDERSQKKDREKE